MRDRRTTRRVVAPLVCGLGLVACAVVWHVGIGPRWTQRIPEGWSWRSEFVGIQTWADPETGELPVRDTVALYDRSISITSDVDRPRAIRVEDRHVSRDPATGNMVWTSVAAAELDPRTGAHRGAGREHDQFVFPRDVEPRSYTLRNGYLKGIHVVFEREDEIDGLSTYVFHYRGPAEYTESYERSDDLEGVHVEPGEEIRCADDQYVHRVWVEPLTGEMIKVEESCYAGDYIYERASGRRVAPVDRFASVTSGNAVLQRVEATRHERTRYLWASRIVPGGLAGLGVALMGVAYAAGRARRGAVDAEHVHAA